MNLILCGLPMSGKTTIGKKLAERLNWTFVDTDRLIEIAYENKSGKSLSCRSIFQLEGHRYFRELEKEQIATLTNVSKSVIASGGGSFSDQDNVKIFKSIGHIIYLKESVETLWNRIKISGVPAYLDQNNPEKSFRVVAENREAFYEAAADLKIEMNGLSEEDVLTIILQTEIKRLE